MIDRVAFTILGKEIYWYGVIIASALLIGMVIAVYLAKKRGYRADLVFDFLIFAVPMAVIGARAYYVIFNYSLYQGDILKIVAIWDGGIAIYGAVIGGILGAFVLKLFKGFPVLSILDICAPSLILGQAIGRWGNFVNQEAYGRMILDDKYKVFPFAVKIDIPKIVGQLPGYYMATFFYEFAWNFIVFIILISLTKKLKEVRGSVFSLYLVLYGIGRYFIEGLRTDSLMVTNTIRVSQLISLVFIFIGAVYFVYSVVKRPKFRDYYGEYLLNYIPEDYKDDTKKRDQAQSDKTDNEAEDDMGDTRQLDDLSVLSTSGDADDEKDEYDGI